MTLKPIFLAGLLLTLATCAQVQERPAPRSAQASSEALMMLNELARVSALTPEQRKRELAAIENARLDDRLRFQAAALLDREDSLEALERGLKNLNALSDVEERAQPLVDQMKKSFKARIELKQQTARAQELQDKLDQIKALEKSLQQRATPPAKP